MESKNILSAPNLNYSFHKIGYSAEVRVCQVLESRGYRLLKHRFKTPFAEVDLVFESPKGGVGIVEVKSLGENSWVENRISKRQIQRLTRAAQFLSENWEVEVSLCVAFVSRKEIQFFPIE